jgi:hypothetical protein
MKGLTEKLKATAPLPMGIENIPTIFLLGDQPAREEPHAGY